MRKAILAGVIVLAAVFCFTLQAGAIASSCTATLVRTSSNYATISLALSNAETGDTIVVSGSCSDNVTVSKDGITITSAASGTPSLGAVPVTAADITKPVFKVGSRGVGIYGFDISGGSIGVQVVNGMAFVIFDKIELNTVAGIEAVDHGSIYLGSTSTYTAGPVSTPQNDITGNPYAIKLFGGSWAKIAGNQMDPGTLTSGVGSGIYVDGASVVEVADNEIDHFVHAVTGTSNSVVNLANGASSPYDLFNTTAGGDPNTGAVFVCTNGAVFTGFQGGLTGEKPGSFDKTCVNVLTTTVPNLVGTWKVTNSSGFPGGQTVPTTATFSEKTGTFTVGGADNFNWTLSKGKLTITDTTASNTLNGVRHLGRTQ